MTNKETRPDDIRNINTIAIKVLSRLDAFVQASDGIEKPVPQEYQKGFVDGIRAVQQCFLFEMENGQLDYAKVNR